MKEQEKSFVFFESWYSVLEDEKPEIQWEVVRAVMEYVFRGRLAELRPQAGMAFKFIRQDIDRTRERYEATVEKRRAAGQRGGIQRAAGSRQQSADSGQQAAVSSQQAAVSDCEQVQADESKCKQKEQMLDLLADESKKSKCKQKKQMVNLLSEKSKKSKCKHNDNVDDNDNDVVDKLQQENNSPLTAARAREGEGEERAAGSGQQSAVSSQRAAGSSQQSAVGGQAAAVNVAVPVGKLYNEMFDEITRQYADGVKTQTMTLLERLGIDTIQAKRERLFLFGQHLKEEGVTEKTRSDFKQHFVSWVKLRLEIEARENENMSKSISSTKKIASNGNNSSTSRAAARLHNTGDFDGAEPKSDF